MITFPGCKSSGNKNSSGMQVSGNVYFLGIVVATDKTNDVSFTVYNGSAADANAVTPKSLTIKGTDNYGGLFVNQPVRCEDGIYVDIMTSGTANYIVYYTEKGDKLRN